MTDKEKANQLRKAKNYKEACIEYEKFWNEQSMDEWSGWGYAFCLSKVGRDEEALLVSQCVLKLDEKHELNNSLYAWIIYRLYLSGKKKEIPIEQLDTLCKDATSRIKQEPYSAFTKIVFAMAERYKQCGNYNKELEWLGLLQPELLSTECFKIKDELGKMIELQSQKEGYYACITKALYGNKEYDRCIEYCDRVFLEISSFHYDNDIWIRSRKAAALGQKGNLTEAIAIMEEIVTKKRHWSLLSNLADLYESNHELDQAIYYRLEAALSSDPLTMKVNLIEQLGKSYTILNELESAQNCYLLCYKLRIREKWGIPESLNSKLTQISDYEQRSQDIKEVELKNKWRLDFSHRINRSEGVITNVFPNGKQGFIQCKGNSYFFHTKDIASRTKNCSKGDKVTFGVRTGFDRKKNKISKEAFAIEIIA